MNPIEKQAPIDVAAWLKRETQALPDPDVLCEEFKAMMRSPEQRTRFFRHMAALALMFAGAERWDLINEVDHIVKGFGLVLWALQKTEGKE